MNHLIQGFVFFSCKICFSSKFQQVITAKLLYFPQVYLFVTDYFNNLLLNLFSVWLHIVQTVRMAACVWIYVAYNRPARI